MAEGNGTAPGTGAAPQLNVLVQYIKDLSFENPNAPQSLGPQEKAPNINIQVNVNARQLSETDYEVSLALEGSAGEGAETLFKFELNYCGVFRLQNIPANDIAPVLLIECPRLLFPFGRQIVGDAVRNGGFPPLFIDPIDFHALYVQRAAASQGNPAIA